MAFSTTLRSMNNILMFANTFWFLLATPKALLFRLIQSTEQNVRFDWSWGGCDSSTDAYAPMT